MSRRLVPHILKTAIITDEAGNHLAMVKNYATAEERREARAMAHALALVEALKALNAAIPEINSDKLVEASLDVENVLNLIETDTDDEGA